MFTWLRRYIGITCLCASAVLSAQSTQIIQDTPSTDPEVSQQEPVTPPQTPTTPAAVLKTAAQIGASHGVGNIIREIIKHESQGDPTNVVGGTHLPVGKRYYGVAQMKVVAVREVMSKNPSFTSKHFGGKQPTDEVIISKLITDPTFSIEAATLYYMHMRKLAKRNTYIALAAYNQGPTAIYNGVNAAGHTYASAIMRNSN